MRGFFVTQLAASLLSSTDGKWKGGQITPSSLLFLPLSVVVVCETGGGHNNGFPSTAALKKEKGWGTCLLVPQKNRFLKKDIFRKTAMSDLAERRFPSKKRGEKTIKINGRPPCAPNGTLRDKSPPPPAQKKNLSEKIKTEDKIRNSGKMFFQRRFFYGRVMKSCWQLINTAAAGARRGRGRQKEAEEFLPLSLLSCTEGKYLFFFCTKARWKKN